MVRVSGVSARLRWAALLAVATLLTTLLTQGVASGRPGGLGPGRPRPAGPKGGGKGGKGHRPHGPRLKPASPLPVLATLSRVELGVDGAFVVVTETLQLARNEWEKGDLRVCIGHGAPGAPKAFDAKFASVDAAETGQTLTTEFAAFCPVNARILLGGTHMATQVVTIPATALSRAFEKSELALLRVRFLIEAPQKEGDSGRELLLRLGAPEDEPITLASIAIQSRAEKVTVTKAQAALCGPSSDAVALTVEGAPQSLATIHPSLTIRRPSDELCVRYWTNAR